MMLWFINFFRGQIHISIKGAYPERFINVCAQNGIAFWDLEQIDDRHMTARVFPSGYEKLMAYAPSCMCLVSPVEKQGVPFLARKLKGRSVLLGGLLVLTMGLWFLSRFIWNIEVVGVGEQKAALILQNLADIGVDVGTYAPSVDIAVIKNEMLLRMEELSWLTVNVKGTLATVEVRERMPVPVIVDATISCDVVAQKTGVIVDMDTLLGFPQVQRGEMVQRGQVLVSGRAEPDPEKGIEIVRLVHAQARITARTWLELEARFPKISWGKAYTGRQITRRALIVGRKRINFYKGDFLSFVYYDKIVAQTVQHLPQGGVVPVRLVTETYREYERVPVMVPGPERQEYLKNRLSRQLSGFLGKGEVVQEDYTVQEDGFSLRLVGECLEEIGLEKPRTDPWDADTVLE